MHVFQNPQDVLLGVPALGHNGLQAVHGVERVRLSWQVVHVQEKLLRAGHAQHPRVDRERGVDERLGDRFPTLGHAHLGVLGRDVGSVRLVPAMSAGVQIPKVYDFRRRAGAVSGSSSRGRWPYSPATALRPGRGRPHLHES